MIKCRVLVSLLYLFKVSVCFSQELEPRSYVNLPINQTFTAIGLTHSDGSLSPSPSAPVEDAELTIRALAVGFAHTFALGGKSAKFDFANARACFEGSAIFQGEYVEGDRCGYNDPSFRVSWNFYGAPALSLQEFSQWQSDLVVGLSLQVKVPIGDYDETKLINMGANRWVIRPGIGMSKSFNNWHFDLSTSVRFFEDNNDYFNGVLLEQEPLYSIQSHLIYTFSSSRWLSLNSNYFIGGETSKNGTKSDDEQKNSRFGITYSMALDRHHSIKLYANTGVITRIGNDFDTFGLFWFYRF